MRALGFVGATRLAAAARLLPTAVSQWQEQWCFRSGEKMIFECGEEGAEAIGLATDIEWKLADTGQGKLWLAANWRRLVFGRFAADAPQDATGTQLVAAAQQALVAGMLEALGAPTANMQAANPVQATPMSARVRLRASAGDLQLLVLVEASLLSAFLAPAAQPVVLVPRAKAIGGARLKVRVRLPFASLTVGEANGLRAGDILQGDTHFLEPLSLVAGDNQTVAKGYLARKGEHLALQLAAHEQ